MRTSVATLVIASLIATLAATAARAVPTQVVVRIEGRSETLFEGPIWTEGHDLRASSDAEQRPCDGTNNDQHATPGPTPTAASADAMSIVGETFDGVWYPGYDDYFVTRWGPDEQSLAEGAYWGVVVDNVFTSVGGCQYELTSGSEALWAYDAFKSRPFLALFAADDHYSAGARPLTATADLGQPFQVEVLDYADDEEDTPPTAPRRTGSSPYQGADVSPVLTSAKGFERAQSESSQTVVTDAEGKASIIFTTPGWHRIKATTVDGQGRESAVRSNRLDVCVPAPGESDCGLAPSEDSVRTPPFFAGQPGEESPEERSNAGSNDGSPSEGGQQPGSGGGPGSAAQSGAGQGDVAQGGAVGRGAGSPGASAHAPGAHLTLERIGLERALLKLATPGRVTLKIARRVGRGHSRRWRSVKTIATDVLQAGEVAIALPRLPAGRYRVTVGLSNANSLVRMLSVPAGRR
jgi:hypothetical protein